MPVSLSLRSFLLPCLIFLLAAVAPGLAQPATAPPARLEQLATAAISPEALPKVLAEGATGLESKLKALEGRLADSQRQLAERENDLKDLRLAVASLRATLAVSKPPLTEVQELVASYTILEARAQGPRQDPGRGDRDAAAGDGRRNGGGKHLEDSGGHPAGRRRSHRHLPGNAAGSEPLPATGR